MTRFGKTLKRIRDEMGLSLAEFSAMAQISRSYLLKLEKEKSEPKLSTALKISGSLGLTITELIYDTVTDETIDLMRIEYLERQKTGLQTKINELKNGGGK